MEILMMLSHTSSLSRFCSLHSLSGICRHIQSWLYLHAFYGTSKARGFLQPIPGSPQYNSENVHFQTTPCPIYVHLVKYKAWLGYFHYKQSFTVAAVCPGIPEHLFLIFNRKDIDLITWLPLFKKCPGLASRDLSSSQKSALKNKNKKKSTLKTISWQPYSLWEDKWKLRKRFYWKWQDSRNQSVVKVNHQGQRGIRIFEDNCWSP